MNLEKPESKTSYPLRFLTRATSLFIEPPVWTVQASFYPESTKPTPGHSSKHHRVFDHSAADGISKTLYFQPPFIGQARKATDGSTPS